MINSFQACKDNNVLIIAEPLGNICGFYQEAYNQAIIHINENINEKHWETIITNLLIYGFLQKNEFVMFTLEQLEQLERL